MPNSATGQEKLLHQSHFPVRCDFLRAELAWPAFSSQTFEVGQHFSERAKIVVRPPVSLRSEFSRSIVFSGQINVFAGRRSNVG
jgi:hypothetical protein